MTKKGDYGSTVHSQDSKGRFTEKVMPYPQKHPDQEQPREGVTVSYTDKTGKDKEKFIPRGGSFEKVLKDRYTGEGED